MIRELEKLCADINFDENIALELIKQIDINEEFKYSDYGLLKNTFLEEAASNSNLKMARYDYFTFLHKTQNFNPGTTITQSVPGYSFKNYRCNSETHSFHRGSD